MNNSTIGEYIDPLGRTIEIKENTWQVKQQTHPEIKGKEHLLEKVFCKPNFIWVSASYANRDVYIWYNDIDEKFDGTFLPYVFGIAAFDSDSKGTMVSIYPSKKIGGVSGTGGIKYAAR